MTLPEANWENIIRYALAAMVIAAAAAVGFRLGGCLVLLLKTALSAAAAGIAIGSIHGPGAGITAAIIAGILVLGLHCGNSKKRE